MFKNYLNIALRNMRRHKVFTSINLIGLVIGITSFMLIMIWVAYEMSFDDFNEKKDRIHRLCVDLEAGSHMVYPMSMPSAAQLLKTEFPEIENIARLEAPTRASIKIGEQTFIESGVCHGDNSLFEIFTFPFSAGNLDIALLEPYSVVISQSMAKKYFENNEPIGKTIEINGSEPYTITGVIEDIPQNSHFRFDIMGSFETLYAQNEQVMANWFHIQFFTYLLLAENTDQSSVEAKFSQFIEKHIGELLSTYGASLKFFLQPLTEIHLHSELAGDIAPQADIKYLYLFILIAVSVLLISCINFINLSTANSASRAKEIGMRKIVGSGRLKIIIQFLMESIVLSFIAMILTVWIIELIRPNFSNLFGTNVDLGFISLTSIILLLMIFPIFVGILAGSYPAFYLSKLSSVNIIKSGFFRAGNKSHLRSILVIIQFSVSIILVISTITIFNQINFMKYSNSGFKEDSMIIIPGVRSILQNRSIDTLKNLLSQIPEIEDVGFSSLFPGRGIQKAIMYPEGFSEDQPQMGEKLFIGSNYIPTLEIEILKGRNFSKEFTTDPQESVIINETAAKQFYWDEPIGKTFSFKTQDGELHKMSVVGMVKDFHSTSLHSKIEPMIIYNSIDRTNYMTLKISSNNISSTIEKLKKQIKIFSPDHALKYYFLDETLDSMYRRDQQTGKLALYFSALTILLSCLGLLGLTTFLVQNRTKEIGIRKVMGASVLGITFLLVKEFCKWIMISVVIAWPISYYVMTKWLQSFAYRTEIGISVFVISGCFALIIAVITVSSQTIKTAVSNPVDALKYE